MTNTPEEVAAAKAMFEHEVKRMNAPKELGHYPYLDAARTAIAASNSKYVAGLVEALKIADAVLSDANQRMKLFRDEPCDIPDIQHIAAINVEALERASNNIAKALNNLPEELRG